MTNDELRKELEILKFIVPETMKNTIKVIEGVLRLPEEKLHWGIPDDINKKVETSHDYAYIEGWNAYREEVRKIVGLTE